VDDVVVVVVEDQGNVEFLTDGEEVVDGPDLKTAHPQIRHGSWDTVSNIAYHIVVLEHKTPLDVFTQ
jgi:hypothetical protein